MEKAIKRMVERGFARIHIDILSKAALDLVEKLDANLRDKLDIRDESTHGDCFDMLEMLG